MGYDGLRVNLIPWIWIIMDYHNRMIQNDKIVCMVHTLQLIIVDQRIGFRGNSPRDHGFLLLVIVGGS